MKKEKENKYKEVDGKWKKIEITKERKKERKLKQWIKNNKQRK